MFFYAPLGKLLTETQVFSLSNGNNDSNYAKIIIEFNICLYNIYFYTHKI